MFKYTTLKQTSTAPRLQRKCGMSRNQHAHIPCRKTFASFYPDFCGFVGQILDRAKRDWVITLKGHFTYYPDLITPSYVACG